MSKNYQKLAQVTLPDWDGVRVQMMPVDFSDPSLLPTYVAEWQRLLADLIAAHPGGPAKGVGYLTIDSKELKAGESHRTQGQHVDGLVGGWGGGGSGWGKGGMVVVSDAPLCRVWDLEMTREQIDGLGCLRSPIESEGELLEAGTAYWLGPGTPHDSEPAQRDLRRRFIRLSWPSDEPWFEGYTANPQVPLPANIKVLPRRQRMGAGQ